MANGWPIAQEVWSGQTADKATWVQAVKDVKERFGLERVIVVSDRGVVSEENLAEVKGLGFRHLVGIAGRRSEEAREVLGRLKEQGWVKVDEANQVQEVRWEESPDRYLVVQSTERQAYEERLRTRSMERTKAALEKIAQAVTQGRLKDRAKIGARAARAMSADHGARYYSYEITEAGEFRYQEDAEKLEAEKTREGRYILKTNDAAIQPRDAVEAYKELATVEAGFRDLKDVLAMRPVWHKTDDRVRAHIFVATLALFLKRTLQHQLDQANVALSATEALEAMKSVGVSELDLNGVKHRVVSGPGPDARRVLNALGIREIHPPNPRKQIENGRTGRCGNN
jgi:transposase